MKEATPFCEGNIRKVHNLEYHVSEASREMDVKKAYNGVTNTNIDYIVINRPNIITEHCSCLCFADDIVIYANTNATEPRQ